MSDKNKAQIQLWCDEGFNKNNMAVADKVYDANVYYHEPAAGEVRGVKRLKEFVESWRAAFPDSLLKIEEQVAEGDKVATRWTFTGTQRGTFRGLSPSGKQVKFSAMYFYRFSNGKVVEIHAMVNTLVLLQQLGAVPQLAQAKG
jgi:steroid delta-isomerase-like uncharacterized protein